MMLQNAKRFVKRLPVFVRQRNTRFINTSAINYKIVKFKLSDIGEGISEVEVIQWNKNEGDKIDEMENLLTVQSDKAAVDITSRHTGTVVKKYVNEKEMAKVGSILCEIDTEDYVEEEKEEEGTEDGKEYDSKIDSDIRYDEKINFKSELDKDNVNEEKEFFNKTTVKASPVVRQKANEHGLDIETVGVHLKKKVITLNDLETYLMSKGAKQTSKTKIDGSKSKEKEYEGLSSNESEEVVLRGTKLAMCKSMNASLTIPLFHFSDLFIITDLIKLKDDLKPIAEKNNVKLTITSLLIKILSNTLIDFPILNSTFNEKKNSYTMHKNHNVCVAMNTPHGLLVPNIKNVNKKNVLQIQNDLNSLRDKAMNNRLSKDDITNGTITISNLGIIGGSFAMPIIFDNQACILAVTKNQKQIFLKNEKKELTSINDLTVEDTTYLTFAADHRFIDGATIAEFSKKMKTLVENPNSVFPSME